MLIGMSSESASLCEPGMRCGRSDQLMLGHYVRNQFLGELDLVLTGQLDDDLTVLRIGGDRPVRLELLAPTLHVSRDLVDHRCNLSMRGLMAPESSPQHLEHRASGRGPCDGAAVAPRRGTWSHPTDRQLHRRLPVP